MLPRSLVFIFISFIIVVEYNENSKTADCPKIGICVYSAFQMLPIYKYDVVAYVFAVLYEFEAETGAILSN